MGRGYTREELDEIRCRVLIQAKGFLKSQGRAPSMRELKAITGATDHAIYTIFGGIGGVIEELGVESKRERELPEELKEKRAEMLNSTKEFCKKHGRMPSNAEILAGECGYTLADMREVFGSKMGLRRAVGVIDPDPEPEMAFREKPFRQETYSQYQKAETLSMVPGIDLSQYAHCTRLGDRHGQL